MDESIFSGIAWIFGSVLALYLWATCRYLIQQIPKHQQRDVRRVINADIIGILICLLAIFLATFI